MVILDTNVLSGLMKPDADALALTWLDRQSSRSVWTTSISIFEIRFGLECMANGKRRHRLESAFADVIGEDIQGRVLEFDSAAANAAAVIAARQRRNGRPVEIRDVQIAGITEARKATLATRNVRHFEGIGLSLVDPWAPELRG